MTLEILEEYFSDEKGLGEMFRVASKRKDMVKIIGKRNVGVSA